MDIASQIKWEAHFADLKQFLQNTNREPRCRPTAVATHTSAHNVEKEHRLRVWTNNQRSVFRGTACIKINLTRQRKLETIPGWVWKGRLLLQATIAENSKRKQLGAAAVTPRSTSVNIAPPRNRSSDETWNMKCQQLEDFIVSTGRRPQPNSQRFARSKVEHSLSHQLYLSKQGSVTPRRRELLEESLARTPAPRRRKSGNEGVNPPAKRVKGSSLVVLSSQVINPRRGLVFIATSTAPCVCTLQ